MIFFQESGINQHFSVQYWKYRWVTWEQNWKQNVGISGSFWGNVFPNKKVKWSVIKNDSSCRVEMKWRKALGPEMEEAEADSLRSIMLVAADVAADIIEIATQMLAMRYISLSCEFLLPEIFFLRKLDCLEFFISSFFLYSNYEFQYKFWITFKGNEKVVTEFSIRFFLNPEYVVC